MKVNTLLLDPGHGIDTAGKRSPILEDGSRLYEYEFNREIVNKIIELAPVDLKVVNLVEEVYDIPLSIRAKRANDYIKAHPSERCIFMSIHGNAAGNGGWQNARGWTVYTTKGQNRSDKLADCVWLRVNEAFGGWNMRKGLEDGDYDKEANFTVIYKTNTAAILTENLFQDNRDDVELMRNESVQYALAKCHIDGAIDYFKSLDKEEK